jgi:nucleoside-diphosphate-sugar epimerase
VVAVSFETRPISVNQAINRFVNGGITFIPRPGTFTTNYCFIDDVVEGHILAMARGAGGEKYILGGENISFIDLFHMVRTLSGTRAKLLETPRFLIQIWALLQWVKYKITQKEPFVTVKGVNHIFCNKTFNSGKAIQQLGYHITPIKEGLHQTIQFLKSSNYGG